MPNTIMLRAVGLHTLENQLSGIPNGALTTATNVVINRDQIIETRRGYKFYGTPMDTSASDTAHQLLDYKGRILRHFGPGIGTTLDVDSDGLGTFQTFSTVFSATTTMSSPVIILSTPSTGSLEVGWLVSGSGIPANTSILSIDSFSQITLSNNSSASATVSLTFTPIISETSAGLRLRGIEANSNFYFTTNEGIKKISVNDVSTLGSASITNAGGVKALDLVAVLDPQEGFLLQESTVAYRIVWGIKDVNTNLILGSPSERAVVYNDLTNLLIPNFNQLLVNLDTLSNVGGINDQNYLSSLKVAANSSPTTLFNNILSLSTKLDNDTIITEGTIKIASYERIDTTELSLVFNSSVSNFLTVGDKINITGLTQGTNFSQVNNNVVAITSVSGTTITGTPTTNYIPDTQIGISSYERETTTKLDLYFDSSVGSFLKVNDVINITGLSQGPGFAQVNNNLITITAISDNLVEGVPATSFTSTDASPIADTGGVATKATFEGSPVTDTGGTVQRLKYTVITPQPTPLSLDPTAQELLNLQVFYDAIVTGLQNELSGIATGASSLFSDDNSTQSATVDLTFTIPKNITPAYFYQIYRTGLTTATNQTVLADLDPGDEMGLIEEANPTTTDFSNGFIKFHDVVPDAFRGANLYTNPNTGEGIAQANEVPPLAKDIVSFRSFIFYSNTSTKFSLDISLLSVARLVSGVSTFTITNGTTTNTYTFVSPTAQVTSITTVADVSNSLNGTYFTLYTANNATGYYVWYKTSGGSTMDPAPAGLTGIEVMIATGASANDVASATQIAINAISDFTATVSTNMITVTNANKGIATHSSNGTPSPAFTIITLTPGTGEDAANKKVLLSDLSTPAQQVDETARSLVRVINRNISDIAYAFYISGPTDIPGLMEFEARTLGGTAFYFNVDSTNTGAEFSPALPISGNSVISDNEVNPNRIYYSKYQQPEAVPAINFIDIGPKDKKILRILALRDNLFVLKEEAIYRISGLSTPFTVSLFDSSTHLKAPDSAVVLNNLIYCFSTQGVATVSDTGVSVVSRPIEDQIISLTSPNFTSTSTATFGVSYESDRSYYLFVPTLIADVFATRCFRYNTFTNAWTEFDISKRSGIVSSTVDLLYLAPLDTNAIEVERKAFDRTDYSDREWVVSISNGAVNNTSVILSSVSNASVGDVLFQEQYLTLAQYNRLLKKLDMDFLLVDNNYYTLLAASPGSTLRTLLTSLAAKLDADAGTHLHDYSSLISGFTSSFPDTQSAFNAIINNLNIDTGVSYKNYQLSTGTVNFEVVVSEVIPNLNKVITQYAYPFIAGNVTIYNNIACEVVWYRQTFNDPSMSKHVREGTFIFQDTAFTGATVSYASDLSPGFDTISFVESGNGSYGNSIYGNGNYGGSGSGIPFRTYIPKDKQRCRYIQPRFQHAVAREEYFLWGISMTSETSSERAWR